MGMRLKYEIVMGHGGEGGRHGEGEKDRDAGASLLKEAVPTNQPDATVSSANDGP